MLFIISFLPHKPGGAFFIGASESFTLPVSELIVFSLFVGKKGTTFCQFIRKFNFYFIIVSYLLEQYFLSNCLYRLICRVGSVLSALVQVRGVGFNTV